jgi:ribonuclease PH
MPNAEGSALIETGNTHVICTATVQSGVPRWMQGKGAGWVTAEYSMLPRSTSERVKRERAQTGGRTQEIQRLIGRSLRAIVDMRVLGENTVLIDCDVLRADGGTRTASITGAFVALAEAVRWLENEQRVTGTALKDRVAAVSVGVVEGSEMLDLAYDEDARAEVDLNIVMTGSGDFVELQGTAEGAPFSRTQLDRLLQLGRVGIQGLMEEQTRALRAASGQ